ncbi:hypothetical protein RYA05_03755 [Pseudomonas syringae pv. actinidiae]|nr:hypothetical protein [Pseudomonas syringae pv. actinidiae]
MDDLPVATKVSESQNRTVWTVKWPETTQGTGKSYYATTYPDSDLLFLETFEKRRPISKVTGHRLHSAAKSAIERALRVHHDA